MTAIFYHKYILTRGTEISAFNYYNLYLTFFLYVGGTSAIPGGLCFGYACQGILTRRTTK